MTERAATLSIEEILGDPPDARTLSEIAAQHLRVLIVDGRLRPGTPLRLTALAASLGVSVMPIREALRRLEAEGLVVVRPRRGAVVAELSAEDAEEIYTIRVALEALCARHGAERLSSADVAGLEELFSRMEEAHQAGDLTAFIECDHAFHSRLYAISGRERLIRMIRELQDRSGRYQPFVYEALSTENPLDAHRPILAAIQAGDPSLVERLTREHIGHAANRLLTKIVREAAERPIGRLPSGRRERGTYSPNRPTSSRSHQSLPGVDDPRGIDVPPIAPDSTAASAASSGVTLPVPELAERPARNGVPGG